MFEYFFLIFLSLVMEAYRRQEMVGILYLVKSSTVAC